MCNLPRTVSAHFLISMLLQCSLLKPFNSLTDTDSWVWIFQFFHLHPVLLPQQQVIFEHKEMQH